MSRFRLTGERAAQVRTKSKANACDLMLDAAERDLGRKLTQDEKADVMRQVSEAIDNCPVYGGD